MINIATEVKATLANNYAEIIYKETTSKNGVDESIFLTQTNNVYCANPEIEDKEKGFFDKIKDFFYGLFNKKSEDKDTNKETTLPIETEQPKTTYTTQTTKNNTLSETGYKLTDSNIINGEIDEVFSQGRIGDCMFLSTLISFTHTQEGRDIIKNAITVNKDENGEIASYDVTFAGIDETYTFTKEEVENNENGKHLVSDEELIMYAGYTPEEVALMDKEDKMFESNLSDYSKGDSDVLLLEMALNKCLNESQNPLIENFYQNTLVNYKNLNNRTDGIPATILGVILTGNLVSTNEYFPLNANKALTMSALKYTGEFMSFYGGQTTDINGNTINIEGGLNYKVINSNINGSGKATLVHPETKQNITINIEQFAEDITNVNAFGNYTSLTKEEILENLNNNTAVIYGFGHQETGDVQVIDTNGQKHNMPDRHAYSVMNADENSITLINPHDSSTKITLDWDEFEKMNDGEFYSYDLS